MSHHNTVFSQLLKLMPRHEFETLANQHHCGRSFRKASRWSQFVTMAMGKLSGLHSLRDIVENISAQAHRLYHLGSAKLSRSNLSRINEGKPYELYEALFEKLLISRLRIAAFMPNLPFISKATDESGECNHRGSGVIAIDTVSTLLNVRKLTDSGLTNI